MKPVFQSRLEDYFPTSLIYFGYLLCPIGVFIAFSSNYFLGAGLLLAGIFLITAHYGISINIGQKQYKEYWGSIGFKNGSWQALPSVEHLYVNRKKYTEVRGSRGSISKFHYTIYRAFLKIDGDESIEVAQSKNQDKVMTKAHDLANRLQVKVIDLTA